MYSVVDILQLKGFSMHLQFPSQQWRTEYKKVKISTSLVLHSNYLLKL